ncbi:MAG: hypothetical protein Q7S65_00220 [Nanoarchaeota archaeon]|nr:hypothetical protein [Nanoarchaeota archaeon]
MGEPREKTLLWLLDTEHAIDQPDFKRKMAEEVLAWDRCGPIDYVAVMSGRSGEVYNPAAEYLATWTQEFQSALREGGQNVQIRELGLGMDTRPLGMPFHCAALAVRGDTDQGIESFQNYDVKDPVVYGIGVYALTRAPIVPVTLLAPAQATMR